MTGNTDRGRVFGDYVCLSNSDSTMGIADMKRTPTIIVAEDDAHTRKLICSMLNKIGARFVEAQDGREAVMLFEDTQPDLVLLDGSMPNVDGFDACKAIRKLRGGASVPILMVTALADSASVKRALAAGASDYLTKPVSWASLQRLIAEHLNPAGVVQMAD